MMMIPRGVPLGILSGGVPPGSPNPDPSSDQKMSFSIHFLSDLASKIHTRFYTLPWFLRKPYPILAQRRQAKSIPVFRWNCAKTLPFVAALIYMAYIGEYPQGRWWSKRKIFSGICNDSTVEPRYEGAKGLAKCVRYIDCEVSLYQGSFLFIYFAITGVKKIVRYTEDFVI